MFLLGRNNMLPVFLECLTVDKDVIHIGSTKDVKDVRSQNIIDVVLEHAWSIGKTKGYDKVFVEA